MKQKNLKLFFYSKWSLFTKLNAGAFRVCYGMHEFTVVFVYVYIPPAQLSLLIDS